ncbi:MAG: phenylacetic acid degradation operon negative regulatory protein PaaX [Candidatus Eremiobacteraeota bacterium]|nr:phenylacetic acid degradation operon negative regulatory protein PaaX [Candidatus Eremiobacteraeota bacterium]
MPQLTPRRRDAFPGLARLRPRSMLFTLYGDYAYPRGVDLGLRSLVDVGGGFGISEVAVRSAVARLARDGWLVARRESNRSYYALTERGRALIEEGTQRIYRPRRGNWNGRWCLLTYAIPEAHRSRRDKLRKQLAWLGFGPLGGGTYVSPRDVGAEAAALAREHGVADYARIFSAKFDGPVAVSELVQHCWDVGAIAASYERFIKHYAPLHARDATRARKRTLPPAEAFIDRFALTHDFRRFPFTDPDLPAALLPRTWPGARARELFERYHALLTDGALAFFRSVAERKRAA